MNIELNEEQWGFLKNQTTQYISMTRGSTSLFRDEKTYLLAHEISERLGSEWIDEEEEIRKFHMGFAYKPKEKNESRSCF